MLSDPGTTLSKSEDETNICQMKEEGKDRKLKW